MRILLLIYVFSPRFSYAVGVYDPNEKTLRITDAPVFNVASRVKSLASLQVPDRQLEIKDSSDVRLYNLRCIPRSNASRHRSTSRPARSSASPLVQRSSSSSCAHRSVIRLISRAYSTCRPSLRAGSAKRPPPCLPRVRYSAGFCGVFSGVLTYFYCV